MKGALSYWNLSHGHFLEKIIFIKIHWISKAVSSSLSFSARSDETKFKPTSGRQPNWQLSIATSQWWQQCQKGGSAERTTAKRRPLHASGGAAAIPLPAGPQSVTKTWAAPSTVLRPGPWSWMTPRPLEMDDAPPLELDDAPPLELDDAPPPGAG